MLNGQAADMANETISLFELNRMVKDTLSKSFTGNYWVVAEISEIKEHSSGHCYLDMVQKDETTDAIRAKARATIWSYTYRMLKPYFQTSTGRPLAPGLKILVSVEVVFHEVFGYSLNIHDIEPTFTLGDIEQKRRETIERLVAEGIFDMNKGLEIPLLPRRIAIISSVHAAGLQDFVNQIRDNQYGYRVDYKLFEAAMQGEAAEEAIIGSLSRIYDAIDSFDIVVIIRGGGSQADLACFDSYWLAAHVAQFPIPVVTGIGHDKDISVVDMVAHTRLKTPTAVAEFILDKYLEADSMAEELLRRMGQVAQAIISDRVAEVHRAQSAIAPIILRRTMEGRANLSRYYRVANQVASGLLHQAKLSLQRETNRIAMGSSKPLTRCKEQLATIRQRISAEPERLLERASRAVAIIENTLEHLNPEHILKKGYSITLHKGKALKDPNRVEKGDTLETILSNGRLTSRVG